MMLRVLAVSMIGLSLAGCVSNSGLSGDVYSASEAKQVQTVTYGTIVHVRPVQIQGGDDNNVIGAIGGAGALLAKCIKRAELIAYEDLGAEALRRLYVEDMPLVVIIDCEGNNLYESGRAAYLRKRNGK